MFKRFCKRMKKPQYRAWLLGRIAVIIALLLILASIATLVIAPIASKAEKGDMTEPTTQAATYTTEAETAATEPPTAPQPTETEVTEAAHTYFNCELLEDLQDYIFDLCEEKQIDPAIIIAMCFHESCYNASAIGDGGYSHGLMQVQPRFHQERMARLGCTNMLDPYQNVTVGIDFLDYLIDRYNGNVEMALVAYNMGMGGAYSNCFSKGVYYSSYSRKVLATAEDLRGDLT